MRIKNDEFELRHFAFRSPLRSRTDPLGTIETGKLADLVAVKGDPFEDMDVMSADNIAMMIKDGEVIKG